MSMHVKQSDSVDKIAISLLDVYPVGAIYMSTSSTDPGSIFGGTWEAWGSGRVPIGVNASDTDFATVEKTGGAKSVNLAHSHTVNSHNHTISHTHTVNSHTHSTGNHTLTVNEIPAHAHTFQKSTLGWPQNQSVSSGETFGNWQSGATWPYLPKVTNTNNAGGGGVPIITETPDLRHRQQEDRLFQTVAPLHRKQTHNFHLRKV